jgi:CRISPR-associated protein Cas2
MTIVVTRDVVDRYRGFLASVMPEIAPGIYVSPGLTQPVRERLWAVVADWWRERPGGSVVLAWKDDTASGRLGIQTLGLPPVNLVDIEGVLVVHRRSAQDTP